MNKLPWHKKIKAIFHPVKIPQSVLKRTDPVIVHIGDIDTWGYPYTKRLLRKIRPEIIVHTGDMADEYKAGRIPQDIPGYKRHAKRLVAIMRRYAKTVYFVYGNNDLPDYIKALAPDFIHIEPNTCTDILGARFLLSHRVQDIDGEAKFYLYGHGPMGDTHKFEDNGKDGKYYANTDLHFHAIFPDKDECIRIPTYKIKKTRYESMKLTFYTPSYKNADGFGGASFGFAGNEDPTATLQKSFPADINGVMLTGKYVDILSALPTGKFQAGIVLLGNAGRENEFVRTLASQIGAPLVGGSGAICPVTGEAALISGHGEAAVFLIADDRYDVTVTSENVHHDILGTHTLSCTGRYIDTIDGTDALAWYNEKRKSLGIAENDFEHLTLTDTYGINAHLSVRDGKLYSGRDADETMQLRYLPKDKAQERIQAFYEDSADAIVFGCAGLKQTLSDSISTDALGLFMFGEVCTVDGHSDFGNLMLSKIKFVKRG